MLIDMVKSFVVGIFPRSSKLINIWKRYSRGEISRDVFDQVYREHVKNVVDLYVEKNLDIIHDPQSNWHDHFRPFTRFEGLEAGPLTRFYENNTFFRRPIFKDTPRFSEDLLEDYLTIGFDDRVDGISIPGPHMWITHSIFKGVDPLKAISELLRMSIGYFLGIGYHWIFLHEPSIVYYGVEYLKVEKLYEYLKEFRENIIIYTYFGKVNQALKLLGELGFRYTIDMRWNRIGDISGDEGPIILGMVDGQNTLLEDPIEIKGYISERFSGLDVWICNNVDLDFLPYEYAVKKVEILSGVRGG